MKARHIVGLVFAAIFIFIGFRDFTSTMEIKDGYALVTGPLVLGSTAADPNFDIDAPFSYPLLVRTIQMAQYTERSDGVRLELSSRKPSERIEITSGDEKMVYENPPLPKWIRGYGYDIFGDISIMSGDQKLRLHERLFEKIYYSDHVHLKQKAKSYVVARKLVKDEDAWRSKQLIDRFVKMDDLAAGDVIATWRSIDPESLAPVYTVYGYVRDGLIGDEDHDIDIYDREVTFDEFQDSALSCNRAGGAVVMTVGAILAVLCLLSKFRAKKIKEQ